MRLLASHILASMSNAPQIAEVAALVGDPARANMLVALLGGHALTATELAYAAGVSPQTTSGHLGKLSAVRLIVLMRQRRHHYYRLAGPHVGDMLESIMHVAINAADEQHLRNVRAQMHHSGLVQRRVKARPTALLATPAAVRMAAQLPDEQSTIIVTTPEPGAVVTFSKPAPNTGEAAKPEPEADNNPGKPQAHGPGGWLIQIGAFELEAEARQHLSEAQLNASTALAAADPFTERVERGDKVLYRARFAGFDKETAAIACKQLKRGHLECIAIKD